MSDKRDDFDFDIVIFLNLDGDIPISLSYGTYLSQLIRFATVCNKVEDKILMIGILLFLENF